MSTKTVHRQKYTTLVAPSAWASAIINMDYSGLEPEDVKAVNTFLARNGYSFADCITSEDAGFCRVHDASELVGAADCQRYWFPFKSQPNNPPRHTIPKTRATCAGFFVFGAGFAGRPETGRQRPIIFNHPSLVENA